jgi:hypothetical protein
MVHHLKERMLLRRSDKPGAALWILPNQSEFSGESRALGSGLESGVILYFVRIRKGNQEGGSPDIQMCDRNRTI